MMDELKNDQALMAMFLSVEAGRFCQKVGEYLRKNLPEDQQHIIDTVICSARLAHMAADEAQGIYRKEKYDDYCRENYEMMICEYRQQLKDLKKDFVLGEMEREKPYRKKIVEIGSPTDQKDPEGIGRSF